MNSSLAPLWKADEPLKVGVYAMKHMKRCPEHGTLVRIDREWDTDIGKRYSVGYVQLIPSGEVISGGGSSSWGPDEFKPISNALDILAAEAFECARQENEAKRHAETMAHEREVRLAAIKAILRCGEAK